MDKKYKIAFLVNIFPTRSETFISNKFKKLLEKGHDVHVFCNTINYELIEANSTLARIHLNNEFKLDVFNSISFYARIIYSIFSRRYSINNILEFRKYCKKNNIWPTKKFEYISLLLGNNWDIIHAHFLYAINSYSGLRYFFDCPIVASIYGADITIRKNSNEGRLRIKQELEQIDAIIFSSNYLAKKAQTFISSDIPQKVIHPEFANHIFKLGSPKKLTKSIRLLSVGRLHWTKGFIYAIQAVHTLKKQGLEIKYRIVGEGPQREELEYAIIEYNLQDIISLEGEGSPESVANHMQWANIYLLPSVREDFGVVLLEAQACGLPIIASDVGGTREAASQDAALFIPPRSPELIFQAIKKLIADELLYQNMQLAGPHFASGSNKENVISELVRFYDTLMQNS